MILAITPDLLALLRKEAEARPAEEICGVLLGTRASRVEVASLVQGENLLARADRYLLSAASLLRADDLARATGRAIVGFYHSHPNHIAVPSPEDRRTGWPDHVYLIITTEEGRAGAICAWRFDEERRMLPMLLDVA